MGHKGFGRVVLVACILSAIIVSAQTQSYLLRSEGDVSVNGTAVHSSALVSNGDIIQTGKGGSAKIAAPGIAMVLGENSHVTVTNGKLAIDRGSASVSSTGRIATVSSQYAIEPVGSNSTKYLISNYRGSLSITSQGGELAIAGPNMTSRNLLAGQKARIAAGNYEVSSAADGEKGQANSFGQLIGPYSSNVCRTAATCYCKTAAQCPNK